MCPPNLFSYSLLSVLALLFSFIQFLYDTSVPIRAIYKTFVYPADSSCRRFSNTFDLTVGFVFRKQSCHLQSLRNRVYLIDSAYILKESIAVFFILQQQYRLKKFIYVFSFKFGIVCPIILLSPHITIAELYHLQILQSTNTLKL